jgi:hypothetical protein
VPLAPRPIVDVDDARCRLGASRADAALKVMQDSVVAGWKAEPQEQAFSDPGECATPAIVGTTHPP